MCFGMSETSEKTSNSTANPAVANAATGNLGFVQNLQNQGFTPYSGNQVAGFSPQQQASFGLTDSIVGNGTGDAAKGMIGNYAGAPAQSVSTGTIASGMSPYMSQYVDSALKPQLAAYDINAANQQKTTNAQATGSGAFGDARTGIETAQNNFLSNMGREGLIGNAYNTAFNTAIGASAQDQANKLAMGTTNANLAETALNRSLGGANALQGLQNQQLGVAQAQNQMGQQQTAQDQAKLTAQYNQWLMAQQYPFQTAQLMNQTVGTGAAAMPASTTTTESKPDNSGLSLLGGLGGSLLGNSGFGTALGTFMFSDVNLKEDISEVGKLKDGTPVFSYRYKGDPTPRIGLMAQDIERRRPDAVMNLFPGGPKVVDYGKATERSRLMSMAI